MIKYCKIKNCRYPISHTSNGHLCGYCNKFGHGIMECMNQSAINYININYNQDIIPSNIQCSFGGCINKYYHTTDGHHCLKCFDRLHSIETCPTNYNISEIAIVRDIKLECPICRTENIIKSNQTIIKGIAEQCVVCMDNLVEIFFPNCGHTCICTKCMNKLDENKLANPIDNNIFDMIRSEILLTEQLYDIEIIKSFLMDYPSYITIYEGMGCSTIIRRLNKNSTIEGLFNHSNDGYSPEKVAKLENFILGYCYIETPLIYHEWNTE